jgi:hypothetical protein
MKPMFALAAGLTAAVLVAGCGPSGPKTYEVSGFVKYDGQDVPDGEVVFTAPNGGQEGGPIKNGRYTLKAREGSNKVSIRGTRVIPGKKGPMGEDWVDSYIPDKYNDKSTLAAEVGSGKTTHDFDLKK